MSPDFGFKNEIIPLLRVPRINLEVLARLFLVAIVRLNHEFNTKGHM